MNPFVELNLSLILLLPWYVVLGWVFWRLTARRGGVARRLLALGVLVGAIAAAAGSGIWAFRRRSAGCDLAAGVARRWLRHLLGCSRRLPLMRRR